MILWARRWKFGAFGGHVNVTDGRYVYMRAPMADNQPLYEFTLMPTHIRSRISPDELQTATLVEPFAFTKGCRQGRAQRPLSLRERAEV